MAKRIFHKIYVKVLARLGLAVDIHSGGKWPSYALSNFYPHAFDFDGVHCGSIEGFLQALKTREIKRQILVCGLSRREAKMRSTDTWKKEQNVFWKSHTLNRHGNQFRFLVRRAYRAMSRQNPGFREALMATGSKRLFHTVGNSNPHDTILTEREFCDILAELRSELLESADR